MQRGVSLMLLTFALTPGVAAQDNTALPADTAHPRADTLANRAPARLTPIIVTATRTWRSVESQPNDVDVLDRAALQVRQTSTIDAAVQTLPGTDVVGDARYGQEVRITMRGVTSGFGTQRALIFLDGRPLTDEYLGTVDVAQFPLYAIERLEIVRGPGSVLYGTNAMGGVVNLIPAHGTDTTQATFQAEAGSFGSYTIAASDGRRVAPWDLFVSGAAAGTDGYLHNGRGDAMDWAARNVFVNVGGDLGQFGTRLYTAYFHGSGTDADYQRRVDRNMQDLALLWHGAQPTGALTTLRIYRNALDQTLAWFVPPSQRFRQHSLGTILSYSTPVAGNHRLTAGAEWRYQFADVRPSPDTAGGLTAVVGNATTWSVFAQDEVESGRRFTLVAGIRADAPPGNRVEPSWRFGINRRLRDGTIFRASVGRAFRIPTISDRLLPLTVSYGVKYAGNAGLQPERLTSAEIGVERFLSPVHVRLTGFLSHADGFWDFLLGNDSVFRPQNIARVSFHGLEVDATTRIVHSLTLSGSYTFTSATYSSFVGHDELVGNRLDDNVRNNGSLTLTYGRSRMSFASVEARFVGDRFTDPENTSEGHLPPFTLIHLLASEGVSSYIRLTLRIENVLDVRYRTRPEFRQPGRAFVAGAVAVF